MRAGTYVPREDFAKTLTYMRTNLADHIAAATQNLRAVQHGQSGPFLEQSLYADELSEESVMELQRLARRIWESALRRMFALANERTRIDERGSPGAQLMRMRFGAYFYSERANPLSDQPATARRGLEGRQSMKALLSSSCRRDLRRPGRLWRRWR